MLATATGTRAAAAATTSCAPGMACALDATTSLTSPSSSASSAGARPGSSNNTVRSAQAAGIVHPISIAFCSGPNDSPRRANSSVSATVQHGSVSTSSPSQSNTTATGRQYRASSGAVPMSYQIWGQPQRSRGAPVTMRFPGASNQRATMEAAPAQ